MKQKYFNYKKKINKFGNSYYVLVPKEALETLECEEGSTLHVSLKNPCSFAITHEDLAFFEHISKNTKKFKYKSPKDILNMLIKEAKSDERTYNS